MYLRYILYPVKLQPDNNLFCTLCATPHSLQAIVMIYPETHFFTIQYLIHPISVLTINNYWLFCYALPTYFVTYRSSSGRSFTRNIYIYMCVCVCVYIKCCQRCAYIKYIIYHPFSYPSHLSRIHTHTHTHTHTHIYIYIYIYIYS